MLNVALDSFCPSKRLAEVTVAGVVGVDQNKLVTNHFKLLPNSLRISKLNFQPKKTATMHWEKSFA